METVHLPGDAPEPAAAVVTELMHDAGAPEEIDMSPSARLERIEAIQGRMAAGELIEIAEVHPKTHSPELVALVQQMHRRRRSVLGVEIAL